VSYIANSFISLSNQHHIGENDMNEEQDLKDFCYTKLYERFLAGRYNCTVGNSENDYLANILGYYPIFIK